MVVGPGTGTRGRVEEWKDWTVGNSDHGCPIITTVQQKMERVSGHRSSQTSRVDKLIELLCHRETTGQGIEALLLLARAPNGSA